MCHAIVRHVTDHGHAAFVTQLSQMFAGAHVADFVRHLSLTFTGALVASKTSVRTCVRCSLKIVNHLSQAQICRTSVQKGEMHARSNC